MMRRICGHIEKKPHIQFCVNRRYVPSVCHELWHSHVRAWPILFTPKLAPKVHRGEKTETRRILQPQPGPKIREKIGEILKDRNYEPITDVFLGNHESEIIGQLELRWRPKKPVFQPYRLLWVKESFAVSADGAILYEKETRPQDAKARSSLLMPAEHTRTLLKVKGFRYEPVDLIDESAARREGFESVDDFWSTWENLHSELGDSKYTALVAVIRFELFARKDIATGEWIEVV